MSFFKDCECSSVCDPEPGCEDSDALRGFTVKRPWNRGDTIILEWSVFDALRVPFDPTDPASKVWFTVKDVLDKWDEAATWQGTYGSGIESLGGNRIRVTIPASVTAVAYDLVKLYYDLQIKNPAGQISTVEKGLFLLSPDVTRAYT